MELGAHLREPRELRQGLLGPARWVTREVLAVTPMVSQVLEILSRVAQENNAHEILDDDWDKGVQY